MAGPDATFAQTWTQWGKVVDLINEHELYGSSNTPNFLDNYDAVITSLDGNYTPSVTPLLDGLRGQVAQPLSREALRSIFRPFLLQLGEIIDAPEMRRGGAAPDARLLFRLRQYMVDNSQDINSRGMTLNTPGSFSGTGNGTFYRVTVDKDGNTLEATGGEDKAAECVEDQTSGAREHEETWELTGEPQDKSGLQWTGSGLVRRLKTVHAKTSNILRNGSFEQGLASASDDSAPSSTTAITGWTISGSASNLAVRNDSGFTYRGYPGAPDTLWAVEFNANETITQIVQDKSPGSRFNPFVPYLCLCRWKTKDSPTAGSITLHLGSKSNAVADVSGVSNDTWQTLVVATDKDAYYDNFVEQDLDVKIAVASLSGGSVVVDDVILVPMTLVDGTFYAVVGGDTSFLRGSTFSWTDSDGTRAKFSYWIWRAYGDLVAQIGGWFPSDSGGTETISDP